MIAYDFDHVTTETTLGFDVVQEYMGRRVRIGTYASAKVATATKEQVAPSYLGDVKVIRTF